MYPFVYFYIALLYVPKEGMIVPNKGIGRQALPSFTVRLFSERWYSKRVGVGLHGLWRLVQPALTHTRPAGHKDIPLVRDFPLGVADVAGHPDGVLHNSSS